MLHIEFQIRTMLPSVCTSIGVTMNGKLYVDGRLRYYENYRAKIAQVEARIDAL